MTDVDSKDTKVMTQIAGDNLEKPESVFQPGVGRGRSSMSPMYVSRPDPVHGVPGGGKFSGPSSTTVRNFSPLDADYRVKGVDWPASSQEPRLVPRALADAKPAPNPDRDTDAGGPIRQDGLVDILRRMEPGDSIVIDATKSGKTR
jgi:hypothetical protein